MKGEFLILFVILLLGLILCSVLGGYNCNKEGMENTSSTFTSPNGDTASTVTNSDGSKSLTVTHSDGTTNTFSSSNIMAGQNSTIYNGANGGTATISTNSNGETSVTITDSNGNVIKSFNTDSEQPVDSGTDSSSSSSNNNNYDNYDHYSGTAYPTIFYGPNGGTARIVQTDNNGTIVTTSSNGATQIYYIKKTNSDPSVKAYYGPNGGSAKIVTDSSGKQAVEITMPDGTKVLYYSDNVYVNTSQDPTINQYDSDTVGTGSDYNSAFSSNSYYGPNGGKVNTVSGPTGNTYSSYDSSAYYNSLPQGVSASQIPPGQEDLYILKSQIVPPVCPKCPNPIVQCPNKFDTTKCPPCPPCSRCPEPSFDCKKVPNYNSFNSDTMPVPVLNDFSTFGM